MAFSFASSVVCVLAAGSISVANDVPIFERVEVAQDVSVVAFGIIEDSRCASREFCFVEERLVVAVIVSDHGNEREYALEMGRPIQLQDGSLELVATSVAGNGPEATPLKQYQLDYTFTER